MGVKDCAYKKCTFASFRKTMKEKRAVFIILKSDLYMLLCCQAVLEQFTYGPFAISCFYSGMTVLEGGSFDDALKETKAKFLPTWQMGVCVWPFIQTVNFCFIPERNRVPFVSVCSFLWTVYLAYMKQKQEQDSQILEFKKELGKS